MRQDIAINLKCAIRLVQMLAQYRCHVAFDFIARRLILDEFQSTFAIGYRLFPAFTRHIETIERFHRIGILGVLLENFEHRIDGACIIAQRRLLDRCNLHVDPE